MSKTTQELIEEARDKWIHKLTDLSRRNNLLYYRALKSGTLELIDVNPKLFNALLQGKSVIINDLFPKEDNQINPEIIKQINSIYKRSISNLEERGLRTLFLAYGMVTWTINDRGKSPQSPLILIPISVDKKGEIKLSRYGEAQINPVLLYFIEKEYGYQITPEQLLNGESDIAEDEIPDIKNIADKLTEIVKNIPDFSINQSSAILSNFAFQKMSMVQDLRENLSSLLNNKLILALAGDVLAQQSIKGDSTNIDPRKLDEINPDDEFLVFDADSSQQTVIDSALKGCNGVIQGPPGTGKSQTIANLIVTLSAQGKRVLFVAEKRAALEVVKKRLEQKKLGHLLLDLHGSDISRKIVMEQIAESLTLIRNSSPINADAIHRRFLEKRQQLNNHVKRLHDKRKPSQKSVYEIQSEILVFTAEEQCQTRFRGNILDKITANVSEIENLLIELNSPSLANLFLKQSSSGWLSMNLSSREDALKISDLVRKINQTLQNQVLIPLVNITSHYSITSVKNLDSVLFLLQTSNRIDRYLSLYKSEIFNQNMERWIEVLSPFQNAESARIFQTILSLLNINDYNLSQKVSDLLKLSSEISQTFSLYKEQIFKENLEQIIQDLRSADRSFFGGITNLFNDKLNNARDKIKRLRFSDHASDEDLIREARQAVEQLKK
uniref:DNA helicase n=1 Tax=Anabaena sp. XPORK15F TaxID=462641 RepID=A0A0U3BX09_9NOST|nr:DNA helicase [Anabaena sp. XPORK15F]